MELLGQLSVATLGLILCILVVDLLRKRFRQAENGDRRRAAVVVECPNKVEGLDATMDSLDKSVNALRVLAIEQVKVLQHNQDGIDRLVEQHKAVDGRETWKLTPRVENVLEETCTAVKDLVREIRKNGKGGS